MTNIATFSLSLQTVQHSHTIYTQFIKQSNQDNKSMEKSIHIYT